MEPMLVVDADTQEFRAVNPLCIKEIRGARDNSGKQAIVLTDDTVIRVSGRRENFVTAWRLALR